MRVYINFDLRQILNFFITGFIFWASAQLFPNQIGFDGFGAIVLVTIIFYIIQTIAAFVCVGIIVLRVIYNNSFTNKELIAIAIIAAVILTCTGAIALMLIDKIVNGFRISGFYAALMLALAISVLTTSAPKSES